MRLLYYSLSLYLSLTQHTYALPDPEPAPAKSSDVPREPCTIRSPSTGGFFDLNSLNIPDPSTTKSKHARPNSWNTTGHDYGYNFTMNFCGGVIEDLDALGGVEGVKKDLWRNVSAYYEQGRKVYSIGQENHWPVLRGRKLVLNYTDGSPCGGEDDRRRAELDTKEIIDPDKDKDDKKTKDDDDDDDDDEDDKKDNKDEKKPSSKKPSSTSTRRKNTIISLLCERDPLAQQLTLNFVGASPDECTYMFEARSSAACAGIEVAKQTLSPSGVFLVIGVIAVLVYLVGGCVYSRVVLQQRGWRQLPNYTLWAGIFGFFRVSATHRSQVW